MNKEPMHCLGMASWVITALISINFGLSVFGYDFFKLAFMVNLPPVVGQIIAGVVLASGVLSLAMYVMSLSGKCEGGDCH